MGLLSEGTSVDFKDNRLGRVSIFCRWIANFVMKDIYFYPSEKLILFLLLFVF